MRKYRAICTCTWEGSWYLNRDLAALEAHRHLNYPEHSTTVFSTIMNSERNHNGN